MKRDPKDPQRHLIYDWEDDFRSFNERSLTRVQAKRLVRRMCRVWRVSMPTVRFLRKGIQEWSYVQGKLFVLNYVQCNEAIVAHEMAHYLVNASYGRFKIPHHDHGPEFVFVYMALLEFAKVAPRVALEASLKAKGIEWGLR